MPILLASDLRALSTPTVEHAENGLVALLTEEGSGFADSLTAVHEQVMVIDIHGPRFSRLNYDALTLVVFDLKLTTLLSHSGRRLVDALGRLAVDDGLTLAFIGPGAGLTGAFLEDGVSAGLNLIPQTVVIPAIQRVHDLNTLLARMSERGLRLLALDEPVCLRYARPADTVTVVDTGSTGGGKGSALMVAFHTEGGAEAPVARLHALTAGMTRGWP